MGELKRGDFRFRSVPHAVFSARGEGVVATFYQSGKLVVQGPQPDLFLERYLGHAPPPEEKVVPDAGRTTLGSDESGKGDYFGPLVVAAVRLSPEDAERLKGGGVADSKRLDDDTVLRLGPALRAHLPFALRALDPEAYNERRAAVGNLNPLLADLHAEVIRELAEPGLLVLVDQFANESLMRKRLEGMDFELRQMPRAEVHLAVAAASVIAREHFLVRLRELSEELGVTLAKGGGSPVDRAGRRFVEVHGEEALGRVAKLHFKNTERVTRRRR